MIPFLPLGNRYRSIALVLLGYICGLAMAVVICGGRVERAVLESQRLDMALSEAKRDLARLGASLAEARRAIIEELQLELTGDAKEDYDEIRDTLRHKLEVLIGKEPAGLDPEVVSEIIAGVELRIEDREYQANPALIVLARKCFFRIAVEKMDEAGPKNE